MTDTALTSNTYQMREANGEFNMYRTPSLGKFSKYNKQYIEGLVEGYTKTIDRLIEVANMSEKISKKTRAKILALMIGLVIDASDASEIKKHSKSNTDSRLIPNMTEISYINDVPFDIDVVECVFKYVSQLLKTEGELEGSAFGDITVSGVHFTNLKDFNQCFSVETIGVESNKELTQDLSYFKKRNDLIRKRLFDFANAGKKPEKVVEIKIRREFKFNPEIQTFQRRKKPIAKKVYDLLANQLLVAYDDLYESL